MFDFAIHRTYVHEARSASLNAGIADAEYYQGMDHEPYDVSVLRSYWAFTDVLVAQWNALVESGFRFTASLEDPYADSASMIADARSGSLRVYADQGVTLPRGHYMATAMADIPGTTRVDGFTTLNDVFRGVHDVLGHAAGGHSFGPKGEHAAWVQHRATMPTAALSALWCETRGQNAFTNFWGNHASLPLSERPYAVQKMGKVPLRLA